MSYTKVVKEQWHRDWNGEDILCDDVDVLILPEEGSVYIEQEDDCIMLTTQQAIELMEILEVVEWSATALPITEKNVSSQKNTTPQDVRLVMHHIKKK